MNTTEARTILEEQLARFSARTHSELVPLVEAERVEVCRVRGDSGVTYHVEIQFFWDRRPGDTIRVMGSIDDAGMRAFAPLTDSRLIQPTEPLRI